MTAQSAALQEGNVGIDDLFSTESAVVAAATAAVFSPRTRETLRKGAVLGVAGALKVGDVVTGAARGAVRGIQGGEGAAEVDGTAAAAEPRPPAPSRRPPRRRPAAAASGGGEGAS